MESVASAATALLIGYVAQGTSTIRVDSVMISKQVPLFI